MIKKILESIYLYFIEDTVLFESNDKTIHIQQTEYEINHHFTTFS